MVFGTGALVPGAAQAADPAPGTLLRSQPLPFYGVARPDAGTVGVRLEYVSTTATGAPVTVSGALLYDGRRGAPRGLVGLGVGGHGLADKCAPTNLLRAGNEGDIATMTALVAAGFAVAVTDYEGLGTPGDHPFGVNIASGRNVVDIVRAARQLDQGGVNAPDLPLALYGYSQGGGAVGSAVEQLPEYAPELPIKAAVVGGVLSSPMAVARAVDGTVWAGIGHAALAGFDAAYGLGLYGQLNAYGRHLITAAKRDCMNSPGGAMGVRNSWIMKHNVLAQPEWRQRADENTLGKRKAAVPVFQFHGAFDQLMSYRDASRLRVQWCQKGSTVRFERSPVTGHFSTEPLLRGNAIRWLEARVAGVPERGNC